METNKEELFISAMLSNTYVCRLFVVGIAGSNPAEIIVFSYLVFVM
jgi:hypothetical protein